MQQQLETSVPLCAGVLRAEMCFHQCVLHGCAERKLQHARLCKVAACGMLCCGLLFYYQHQG